MYEPEHRADIQHAVQKAIQALCRGETDTALVWAARADQKKAELDAWLGRVPRREASRRKEPA